MAEDQIVSPEGIPAPDEAGEPEQSDNRPKAEDGDQDVDQSQDPVEE